MSTRYPLKRVIDLTTPFERLPVGLLVILAVSLSAGVAWQWKEAWAGAGFGLFVLGDGLMLALLRRGRRSFGPIQLPWLGLIGLRLVPALIGAAISGATALAGAALIQIALSAVATYACWVEPLQLGLTSLTLRSPRLNGGPPLRLLQISDLHVEYITAREQALLRLVEQCAPDLIVLTGDYLNISYTHDAAAQSQVRELLGTLQAPLGVYAILGSPSVDPPHVVSRLFAGLDIRWLRDERCTLAWHGHTLCIAGVECSYDLEADVGKLQRVLDGGADDAFTLLLYHTPDVMPAAVRAGVDLYLAGHTHGGQLRLPWFGAILTASRYGKRYEMGEYHEGRTMLYVSRGIGLEGKGAPRARFLCPPELVLFTLRGSRD
jgi:predicted MPP superfamily phosphohydrolase